MNYLSISPILPPSLSFSLPEAFPVPVAVCLGAIFYYLQNSTGKILRQRLPSNKDLTVPPQERSKERPRARGREEGGRLGRGEEAALRLEQQQYRHSWSRRLGPSEAAIACSPVLFESPAEAARGDTVNVNQFIWGYCVFIKGQVL